MAYVYWWAENLHYPGPSSPVCYPCDHGIPCDPLSLSPWCSIFLEATQLVVRDSDVFIDNTLYIHVDYWANFFQIFLEGPLGYFARGTAMGVSGSAYGIEIKRFVGGDIVGHTNAGSSIYNPSGSGYRHYKAHMIYDNESSQSDNSSSSISYSESTSSADIVFNGLTYYSEMQNYKAISNPLVDNNVQMQFQGFFDIDWEQKNVDFDKVGYGIKKTKNNKGVIFSNNAAKLLGMNLGYVEMILSFPYDIVDGVYEPLKGDNLDLNEYLLWGINIGNYDGGQPGFVASLTPRGIEFKVRTGASSFVMADTVTNAEANTDVHFQFFWDINGLFDVGATMAFRVNYENTQIGNPPISNDSLEGLNFYVLDTPKRMSNLECTIKRLAAYNEVPAFIYEEWMSSSSVSESSDSSMGYSSMGISTSSSESSWMYSSSSESSSSSSSYWAPLTCPGTPPLQNTYVLNIWDGSLCGMPPTPFSITLTQTSSCYWETSIPAIPDAYGAGYIDFTIRFFPTYWYISVGRNSHPPGYTWGAMSAKKLYGSNPIGTYIVDLPIPHFICTGPDFINITVTA